jgi:hypothetical protein
VPSTYVLRCRQDKRQIEHAARFIFGQFGSLTVWCPANNALARRHERPGHTDRTVGAALVLHSVVRDRATEYVNLMADALMALAEIDGSVKRPDCGPLFV